MTRNPQELLQGIATSTNNSCNSEPCQCLLLDNIYEPKNIEEALQSRQATEWKQAADAEMKALQQKGTWKLVKLPTGRSPVGYKWVFSEKEF